MLTNCGGRCFFDKGSTETDEGGYFEKGEFTIIKRVEGTQKYKCQRVFPTESGVTGEIVEFDMVYLMRRVREYEQE